MAHSQETHLRSTLRKVEKDNYVEHIDVEKDSSPRLSRDEVEPDVTAKTWLVIAVSPFLEQYLAFIDRF